MTPAELADELERWILRSLECRNGDNAASVTVDLTLAGWIVNRRDEILAALRSTDALAVREAVADAKKAIRVAMNENEDGSPMEIGCVSLGAVIVSYETLRTLVDAAQGTRSKP